MFRFLKFISIFIFVGSAALGMIDDQQSLLVSADTFMNGQDFAWAFNPSQEIRFENIECIGRWGCSDPVRLLAKVEFGKEGEVFVSQYSTNHQLKARERIQQTQWEKINRNYLRAKLNSIESFGFKVTLNEFSEINCPSRTFITNQDRCAKAMAVAINSRGQRSDYTFILWRSPTALGQILESIQADSKPIERTIKYQLTAFKP